MIVTELGTEFDAARAESRALLEQLGTPARSASSADVRAAARSLAELSRTTHIDREAKVAAADLKELASIVRCLVAVVTAPLVPAELQVVLPKREPSLRFVDDAQTACAEVLPQLIDLSIEGSVVGGIVANACLAPLVAALIGVELHVSAQQAEHISQWLKLQSQPLLQQLTILLSAPALRTPKLDDRPASIRRAIAAQMTAVLMRIDGVRATADFVLQPDANGDVDDVRIRHFVKLVATRPATVTPERYYTHIGRGVCGVLQNDLATKSLVTEARRKACVMVCEQLVDTPAFVGALRGELSGASIDADLALLLQLSAHSRVAAGLLKSPPALIRVLGVALAASQAKQTQRRDDCERLLYRCIAADDTMSSSLAAALAQLVGSPSDDDSKAATSYATRLLDSLSTIPLAVHRTYIAMCRHDGLSRQPVLVNFLLQLQTDLSKQLASANAAALSTVADELESVSSVRRSLALGLLKTMLDRSDNDWSAVRHELERMQRVLSMPRIAGDNDLAPVASVLSSQLELILARQTDVASASQPDVSAKGDPSLSRRLQTALRDVADESIPARAHGARLLASILEEHPDAVPVERVHRILLNLLAEPEPFVHVNAVKAAASLCRTLGGPYEMLLRAELAASRRDAETKGRIERVLSGEFP